MARSESKSTGKFFLIFSIFIAVYWSMVRWVDLYYFAVTGALYEILWFPMIACAFIVPVVVLVLWGLQKFRLRSFYFYSFLILLIPLSYFLIFS